MEPQSLPRISPNLEYTRPARNIEDVVDVLRCRQILSQMFLPLHDIKDADLDFQRFRVSAGDLGFGVSGLLIIYMRATLIQAGLEKGREDHEGPDKRQAANAGIAVTGNEGEVLRSTSAAEASQDCSQTEHTACQR